MSTNFYDILGVKKTSSEKEIKIAFRKLAHQHHPDKGGDEKKFKEINEAYQTLSKADKRKQYDTFGSASAGGFGNAGGFGGSQGGFNNASYAQYADMFSRRRSSESKIFSFKSIPGWAWLFLLPIIVVAAVIGLIFVFIWVIFSTFRVTVNK